MRSSGGVDRGGVEAVDPTEGGREGVGGGLRTAAGTLTGFTPVYSYTSVYSDTVARSYCAEQHVHHCGFTSTSPPAESWSVRIRKDRKWD